MYFSLAKHDLKIVTLSPVEEKSLEENKSTSHEENKPQGHNSRTHNIPVAQTKIRGRKRPKITRRGEEIPVPRKYLKRVGYYFQHYPYNRLDHFYQMNPHLYYNYPAGYEHIQWYYPIHRTPYFQGDFKFC
jgi:hypothetical protein